MRTIHLMIGAFSMACAASTACGSTLLVDGFWEGDVLPGPELGSTQDYYKFTLVTSGTVRIEVPRLFGGVYSLAAFIGVEEDGKVPFGFIGNPYRLEANLSCEGICTEPRILERLLPAGQYVIVATAGGPTSYDVYDGYVAVNREGGGFGQAPYAYSITGDVKGLEYWDGHLDGTFTVTTIPEPGTAILLGVLSAFILSRRRSQ